MNEFDLFIVTGRKKNNRTKVNLGLYTTTLSQRNERAFKSILVQ